MKYFNIEYISCYEKYEQIPTCKTKEILLLGKSNVGKSSIINLISNKKHNAFVSNKPGKTKMIHFFKINDNYNIIDLPGYGYANISKNIKNNFFNIIYNFINSRLSLKCIILVLDIRNITIKDKNLQICNYISKKKENILIHVILNKSDKLNKYQQKIQLHKASNLIKNIIVNKIISFQILSTKKKFGCNALLTFLTLLTTHTY